MAHPDGYLPGTKIPRFTEANRRHVDPGSNTLTCEHCGRVYDCPPWRCDSDDCPGYYTNGNPAAAPDLRRLLERCRPILKQAADQPLSARLVPIQPNSQGWHRAAEAERGIYPLLAELDRALEE